MVKLHPVVIDLDPTKNNAAAQTLEDAGVSIAVAQDMQTDDTVAGQNSKKCARCR